MEALQTGTTKGQHLFRVHVRRALPLVLDEKQRSQLKKWSRGGATPYRLVIRAQIVLFASYGETNRSIARRLRINPITVARWRSRFALLGIEGIRTEAPRYGSPPPLSEAVVQRIIDKTLQGRPPGRRHWSTRSLALELGVSHSTVRRVWKSHGIRPNRSRVALLARESQFRQKRMNLVGMYVNPPQRAVAVSLRESSSLPWAKMRTLSPAAAPPPPPGSERPWMQDLITTLNLMDRSEPLRTSHRYLDQEFLAFLRSVDERRSMDEKIFLLAEPSEPALSPHLVRWLSRHPQIFAEQPVGPEAWQRRVVGWLERKWGGLLSEFPPDGLPELMTAVARWKQRNANRFLPFAWTLD